ncbi:MAG: hypothetical protein P1Q69_09995 [Candidatus Thorarchaeota archaeon]|nr:hypothetical protein [Candidatus Thorarchaeota archaeon]
MNEMIKTIYVLHQDGVALLCVSPDKSLGDGPDSFMSLFGGFSSAINTLLINLGHKELKSITVGDGVLVYSSQEPLLFVVHATSPKSEQFAKILVKQIEYEFFKFYNGKLDHSAFFVESDNITPFESNINLIYDNLKKLNSDFPELLEFLPSFIPLSRLYAVLNLGLDIIEGYPDDTIKIVRQLSLYFIEEKNLEEVVAQTLGRYSGHMIAKDRFQDKFVIDPEKVLELLNEISVTKFDQKNEYYDIVLCPVCRGKTAEKPICHFFSGFIEGAFDNPNVTVEEISCRGQGDKSCRFKLMRV